MVVFIIHDVILSSAAHSDLLLVSQVCWRWCQPCCSWGTWFSRKSATLTRPPCLMTPVHTFTRRYHHFLCACSLFHFLKPSQFIHYPPLRPPTLPPCLTPSCPESVSPAGRQCDWLHTSHPVSQNQGLHQMNLDFLGFTFTCFAT